MRPAERLQARLALVEEGGVRMAPLLGAPRLLKGMGIDPGQVIAEAGLDAALFQDPENVIPFIEAGRFLALCAEHTGCPHLGLMMGQRAGLDVLGVVGRLVGSSGDVGSALRNAILYLHLHDRGLVPALWTSGKRAVLAFAIYQPDVPGSHQIYDLALAISCNVLKTLAGPRWQANEVWLHRPQPADVVPYRSFFHTRVRFDAERAALLFDASWLDRPLDGADGQAHQQVMQEIEALEARGAGDTATQIRRALRRLLVGGAYLGAIRQDYVSGLFAIHRRTLNRRLKAQGTSFKRLVDESRYEIACQLLRDTQLTVTAIAAALNYSETAAFDRAFRRWSGTTPMAWRSAHSGQ